MQHLFPIRSNNQQLQFSFIIRRELAREQTQVVQSHHQDRQVNKKHHLQRQGSDRLPDWCLDYAASPKKRKAQGSRNPTPARSSARQYKSPSFSHIPSSASTAGRRGGHSRDRSDASAHGYEGISSVTQSNRRGTFSAEAPEELSSAPAESYARGSSPPETLDTQKHTIRRHTRSDDDYQYRRYREKSTMSASLSFGQNKEG